MKPLDLEPLDADLADLLGAERTRPPVPADVRARVLARVMATVGPAGGGGGSPSPGKGAPPAPPAPFAPPAASGGLLVKPLLLGAALGSVVAAVIVTRPEPGAAPRPAVTASFEASPLSLLPAGSASPVAPVPPAAASPVAPAQPSASASREESLAAERRVLDEVQRALAEGRGAAAFEALAEHAREFPRGRLAEEREGLWIRALVRAGRAGEARDRAARFRAVYPHSILLPAIEETLGTIP